ncbi:TetR/AcrR family transcriptional regulator [Roseococcus pinisoli]|uniref:TetR family transcriptional regulator n=1 Tax=Roseococcus pinisoli TaxID=2835040 RepID=A0ABS5QJT1_9PROT|nr:TetR/AcrR family transcriptional regulator [Roseococcus pinisoli]MBS7813638.1 TetR family transcriptional regulator [Roseococcus pinisoli]
MGLSPEQVKRAARLREKLLASAAALLVRMGVHGLTLDAVARDAAVSKGGLLHHFASKSDLLQALMDDIYSRYLGRIDELSALDPESHGRYTRAYIRAALSTDVGHGQAALIMALLLDPTLRSGWLRKAGSLLQKDITEGDPGLAQILRLAADGLWLSEAFSIHELSAAEREALEARLIGLTYPMPGRALTGG